MLTLFSPLSGASAGLYLWRLAAAFNPNWNAPALYLPCDRMALPGHEQWIVEHPELLWKPARGIVHYMEIIHELLASFAYFEPVQPAA
ncbi:DUF7665 family protein [Mesorhizobium sp. PL10]